MTAKKRAKKRVRCKYRKGDVLDHGHLGGLQVLSTHKVGPKSFNVEVLFLDGRIATVSQDNLIAYSRRAGRVA